MAVIEDGWWDDPVNNWFGNLSGMLGGTGAAAGAGSFSGLIGGGGLAGAEAANQQQQSANLSYEDYSSSTTVSFPSSNIDPAGLLKLWMDGTDWKFPEDIISAIPEYTPEPAPIKVEIQVPEEVKGRKFRDV